MKIYTIFAGVNGAGKTSIYKSIYYNENKNEKRINTDEMVSKIGSWKDANLQIKCAREAVKLIRSYILEGISFNQETTLWSNTMDGTIRKNIKIGAKVLVVQKQDQRSGKLTEGVVSRLLTKSEVHPRGIKVMLDSEIVGRVQEIK